MKARDLKDSSDHELIEVLTAISKVSMKLAVKLEMLDRLSSDKTRKGDCGNETLRSQSGNRVAYCKARP